MKHMNFFIVFLSLSFLTCATVNAQADITMASTNPFQNQLSVKFSNGAEVLADYETQTIFVSSNTGQVFEIPFSQAIAAAESDPAQRPQTLAMFQSSLTDNEHIATIRSPRIATDTSVWPNVYPCGPTICVDSVPDNGAISGGNFNFSDCNHFLCPSFPCNFGPCGPNQWTQGQLFYSGHGAGWGEDEGGGSTAQQALLAYDKKLFESQQQGACTDSASLAIETSGIGAGAGVACGASLTGGGAVACAAGIVLYGISFHRLNKALKLCQASYPGPGNW